MNDIINYIKEFAAANGLKYGSGFARLMSGRKLDFPLVWLEPLEVIGKTGITEGVVTYKLKLHIMEKNQNLPQEGKEQKWEEMQQKVMGLCEGLFSAQHIVNVRKIACAPVESAFTNYGELSLTATLEVDSFYCK